MIYLYLYRYYILFLDDDKFKSVADLQIKQSETKDKQYQTKADEVATYQVLTTNLPEPFPTLQQPKHVRRCYSSNTRKSQKLGQPDYSLESRATNASKEEPGCTNVEVKETPVSPVQMMSKSIRHMAVVSKSVRSPTPSTSSSQSSSPSWTTCELLNARCIRSPKGSVDSSSSLPCPSLCSISSQCDTDYLVIADPRSGLVPEDISDISTDDLVEADPYARNTKVVKEKSSFQKRSPSRSKDSRDNESTGLLR